MKRMTRKALMVLAAPMVLATCAQAQVPPDAGSLMRQQQTTPTPPPRHMQADGPLLRETPTAQATRASLQATPMTVQAFAFSGTSGAFSEAQLQAAVTHWLGRPVGLADLQEAANAITRLYRAQGYFLARAWLPRQDVTEGRVTIAVSEGRLDPQHGVRVMGEGLRFDRRLAQAMLYSAQPPDQGLRQASLERGLLLLSDQPGLRANASLEPGSETGTTQLALQLSEGPLLSGHALLDNYGNRLTGDQRLSVGFTLNDPQGRGEQYSMQVTRALNGDFSYARLGYSQPLGSAGLRAGLGYSAMAYAVGELIPDPHAKGTADSWNLNLRYPLLRSRQQNLYVSGSWESKRLYNKAAFLRISDKRLSTYNLGLQWERNDALRGGGMTAAGLSVSDGRLDLSADPGSLAQDQAAAGAHTQGGYNKLNWNLTRVQRLTDSINLSAHLYGQNANRNLDSAEKFQLGGAGGVRAYPASEATGDEGQRATLEGNWAIAGQARWGFLAAQAFYDWGRVRQFKTPAANLTSPNDYELSSWGLGLSLARPESFDMRLQWAQKIGSNPAPTPQGKDANGRADDSRVWFSLIAYF